MSQCHECCMPLCSQTWLLKSKSKPPFKITFHDPLMPGVEVFFFFLRTFASVSKISVSTFLASKIGIKMVTTFDIRVACLRKIRTPRMKAKQDKIA